MFIYVLSYLLRSTLEMLRIMLGRMIIAEEVQCVLCKTCPNPLRFSIRKRFTPVVGAQRRGLRGYSSKTVPRQAGDKLADEGTLSGSRPPSIISQGSANDSDTSNPPSRLVLLKGIRHSTALPQIQAMLQQYVGITELKGKGHSVVAPMSHSSLVHQSMMKVQFDSIENATRTLESLRKRNPIFLHLNAPRKAGKFNLCYHYGKEDVKASKARVASKGKEMTVSGLDVQDQDSLSRMLWDSGLYPHEVTYGKSPVPKGTAV